MALTCRWRSRPQHQMRTYCCIAATDILHGHQSSQNADPNEALATSPAGWNIYPAKAEPFSPQGTELPRGSEMTRWAMTGLCTAVIRSLPVGYNPIRFLLISVRGVSGEKGCCFRSVADRDSRFGAGGVVRTWAALRCGQSRTRQYPSRPSKPRPPPTPTRSSCSQAGCPPPTSIILCCSL